MIIFFFWNMASKITEQPLNTRKRKEGEREKGYGYVMEVEGKVRVTGKSER